MADSSPPTKPKPGSLRDRIAAFEKPAPPTSNPKPPPVRPKPGHVAWKPAPPSPTENSEGDEKKKVIGGGMSASDAKESIRTGGGSLKERMAALQGMGAFGGGSPGPPPPPGPKPVKRPPLVVPSPAEDPEETGREPQVDEEVRDHAEPERATTVSPESPEAANNNEATEELDEEAKERERRAAIAARMARLGGARVGMAPPMVGPKPVVKPKPVAAYGEKSLQKDVSTTVSKPASTEAVATSTSNSDDIGDASLPVAPPSTTVIDAESSETTQKESLDDVLTGKRDGSETLSSPNPTVVPPPSDTSTPPASIAPQVTSPPISEVSATSSHSPPPSVPIPSAPRRAAPPRKKKVDPKKQDSNPSETISPVPAESPEAAPTTAPVDAVETREEDHDASETAGPADKPEENAIQEGKVPPLDNAETAASEQVVHEAADNNVATTEMKDEHEHVQELSEEMDLMRRPVEPDEAKNVLEERPPSPPLAYEPEPASAAEAESIEAANYGTGEHDLEVPTPAGDEYDDDAAIQDAVAPVADKDTTDNSFAIDEEVDDPPPRAKLIDTGAKDIEEADEDEEEARKRRLAEKITKMGGLNPFAAAPVFPPRPNLPLRTASQDDEHDKVVEFANDDAIEEEDNVQEDGVVTSPVSVPHPANTSHDVEDLEASINASNQESEAEMVVSAAQNEVEADEDEDEVMRKRRIAERIAKMGGRNPFSAAPAFSEQRSAPQRTLSKGSESDIKNNEDRSHVELQEEKDEALDDEGIPDSGEVDNHEDEVEYTRVSSEADVIQFHSEESVKESETEEIAFYSGLSSAEEPIELSDAVLPEQEDILPEEGEDEEDEEMAPTRILRPIPPLPPLSKPSDTEVSPVESPVGRAASPRRSLPPPPIEEVQATQHVDEPEETLPEETTPTNDVYDAPPPPPPRVPSAFHKRENTNLSTSSSDSSGLPSPPRRSVPSHPVSDEKPLSPSSPPIPRQAMSPPGRPPIPQMRSMPQQPNQPSRRSIPSPPRPQLIDVRTRSPIRTLSQSSDDKSMSPADTHSYLADPSFPSKIITRPSFDEDEVLPDSEPDPVDPSLPSPRTPLMRSPIFPSGQELSEDPQESDEQARRRTIAERMAKLGGIKFGAPPPLKRPVPPPRGTSHDENSESASITPQHEEKNQEEAEQLEEAQPEEEQSEEAERTRRQAIAARLAGMGGMRFGMLPQTSTPFHPRVASGSSTRSEELPLPPPQQSSPVVDQLPRPPQRHAPVLPMHGSEGDKESGSEDGVKVEANESEMSMEEVHAEDVEEEVEEIPPPPPPRDHSLPPGTVPPPPPRSGRPFVPALVAERRQSTPQVPASNDFVMVGDETIPPPPPPMRAKPSHRPTNPPPVLPPKESETPPWELPDIPSGSFSLSVGANFAMDASITSEDSTTYPPPASSSTEPVREAAPPRAAIPVPAPTAQSPPNPEELLRLANSIGKLVHKAAALLFDKSKKVVVGDGTSQGFVNAVLAQVPQASRSSLGYLVYTQTGNNVTRRLSNIMPGDIVELTDAKLKGHKGLQSYHQSAGTAEEPLVAIIGEFDTKKSKVKVFQANQHVGSQTVESVSYRLDDLKSGTVKIFRIASA